MSSSQRKSVLILGGKASKDPNSPFTAANVSKLVNAEIAKFDAANYDAVFYGADFDNPTEALSEVRSYLKERHWDAVNIGFGLRGFPEYTALFEQVVNLICEQVIPAPKFLFATGPDLVYEAGERVLFGGKS